MRAGIAKHFYRKEGDEREDEKENNEGREDTFCQGLVRSYDACILSRAGEKEITLVAVC